MPRKKRDFSREVIPDPKYKSAMITRFINMLMRQGKRGIAEKALYHALDIVQKKLNADPLETLIKGIGNVRPLVEVRSRRVGGATYQVPTEVRADRGESLAIRWLVQAANSRGEKTISDALAGEFMDAASNRGISVKKREDTHRMAEANKAFAHFKW